MSDVLQAIHDAQLELLKYGVSSADAGFIARSEGEVCEELGVHAAFIASHSVATPVD